MPPQQQYPPYGPPGPQGQPVQPGQPYAQPNPSQFGLGNEYDFIFSPGSPQKPGVFNKPKMLLFIVGILAVLIIGIVVVMSLLSGSKEDTKPFTVLVQHQTEIVRVADLGYRDAADQGVKNFVLTTKLTVTADKKELTSFLNKGGIKISEEELALMKNTSTDKALENAKATSTLDSTLTKELEEELLEYREALQAAQQRTDKAESKKTFKKLYDNAGLLLKQAGISQS